MIDEMLSTSWWRRCVVQIMNVILQLVDLLIVDLTQIDSQLTTAIRFQLLETDLALVAALLSLPLESFVVFEVAKSRRFDENDLGRITDDLLIDGINDTRLGNKRDVHLGAVARGGLFDRTLDPGCCVYILKIKWGKSI